MSPVHQGGLRVTVAEWVRRAEARLRVDAPRLEAQLLAAHALGVSRTAVLAHPGESFPELAGESLLQRREAHEPLAYILGAREFYGRMFAVGPGVLVPRHETETLVEACLGLDLPEGARVLDVGVGSGCVGITLALERPSWRVAGGDVSPLALDWAGRNAEALGASVELVESDLFARAPGPWDLVVSNPPYIARGEPPAPRRRRVRTAGGPLRRGRRPRALPASGRGGRRARPRRRGGPHAGRGGRGDLRGGGLERDRDPAGPLGHPPRRGRTFSVLYSTSYNWFSK